MHEISFTFFYPIVYRVDIRRFIAILILELK